MGFVSCIEDMTTRFQEMASNAMVGPVSAANVSGDLLRQLEHCLDSINISMFKNCRPDYWVNLANNMDRLGHKVTAYKSKIVMQSATVAISYASELEEEMQRVLEKAQSSLELMKNLFKELLPILRQIDNQRNDKRLSSAMLASSRVYQDATFMLHQYRVFSHEYETLVDKCETLQIELAGDAQAHLFATNFGNFPDKD